MSKVELSGIELEGKYYLNRSLFLEGSVLYMLNKIDTITLLTPIPKFGAKAGISYVWERGLTISLFNIYQGKADKHYTGDRTTSDFEYDLLNLHSKFNLNKLFGLKFKPELSLFADIDNLLDAKYYFQSRAVGGAFHPWPHSQGREIYFGLNVTF